ncbi:hypothetical protein R1flu_006353 [Riccia fluitans]|uniref:Protein kinase domain-containing protein n=1 Tax=Riccia fluitans TaxID=41844 RepID=A0ABD1YWU0_9MARC
MLQKRLTFLIFLTQSSILPSSKGGQARPRSTTSAGIKMRILSSDNDVPYLYKIIKRIDEGESSEIFEVEDLKNPPTRLEMKVRTKNEKWAEGPFSGEMLKLYKELLILSKILPKHQNIAQVKEVLISENKIYICSELCSRAALMDDFYECADKISSRRIFQQLCQVVRVMHQHGVFHLNLRADNVLFPDENYDECKVVDFSQSGYIPTLATDVSNGFRPEAWFSPEELTSDVIRRGRALDDIKALGRILHGVLCGRYVANPQNSAQEFEIYNNHPPREGKFDDSAYDLLKKIGPRPYGPESDDKFPSMDTICHHPWIRQGDVNESLLSDLNDKLSAEWENLPGMAGHMIGEGVPVRILHSDLELEEHYGMLGNVRTSGSNSNLLQVIDNNDNNNKQLAVKVVVRKGSPNALKDHAKLYPVRTPFSIRTEVLIVWRALPRHEHIIELKAVLVSKDFAYFVTPLSESRATLADFLQLATNGTSKDLFRQLAETVRFMHQHGVVHMDLRPEHILFKDKELKQIEITNFSRAAYVAEVARTTHNGFKASKWFGPEYMGIASKYGRVTADIRALGRILHAMICGNSDPGLEYLELFQNQGKDFEDSAFNLLYKIGPSPIGPAEDRKLFSIDQICNHHWLAKEKK